MPASGSGTLSGGCLGGSTTHLFEGVIHMSASTTDRTTSAPRAILGLGAVCIAVLALVKFLSLLMAAGFDPARAPWAFLVLALPFVIGLLMLPRRPRPATVLLGTCSAAVAVWTVAVVALNGPQLQDWSDYLVVYLGGPIALATAVAAWQTFRRSH
jgi:peptidoglycan/LPS O-acetylase OafA/YrhL